MDLGNVCGYEGTCVAIGGGGGGAYVAKGARVWL